MRYKLRCLNPNCQATCWVDGDYEYDTNAVNLDEKSEYEWETDKVDLFCEHSDFEIIDEESQSVED